MKADELIDDAVLAQGLVTNILEENIRMPARWSGHTETQGAHTVVATSIIIPAYMQPEMTELALQSIAQTTGWLQGDVEVVVVNNGGCDDLRGDVTVTNFRNRGFAIGCNQGAGAASGNTLVFLNNDTVCHPGWLEPLIAGLEHGVVSGSKLVYPDGRIQHAGVGMQVNTDEMLEAYNITTDEPSRFVPAVTGACLAISAENFHYLSGFDDGFYNGYEDVDLCLRAEYCWYAAESVVTHYESASGPERWAAVQQNIDRLQRKWKDGVYPSTGMDGALSPPADGVFQ